MSLFTSLEMCAGAGGQALGLEMAGFGHEVLVEIEPPACATLRLNRPEWNVQEQDLRQFNGLPYFGVDLVAGGVPCPPFSKAGKQLGADDERDLFPYAACVILVMLKASIAAIILLILYLHFIFIARISDPSRHSLHKI